MYILKGLVIYSVISQHVDIHIHQKKSITVFKMDISCNKQRANIGTDQKCTSLGQYSDYDIPCNLGMY